MDQEQMIECCWCSGTIWMQESDEGFFLVVRSDPLSVSDGSKFDVDRTKVPPYTEAYTVTGAVSYVPPYVVGPPWFGGE